MLSNFNRSSQEVLERELAELVKESRSELSGFALAAEKWVME